MKNNSNKNSQAKISLLLCLGILSIIYFNYPIYSEGFSYFIFFVCFIVIIFSITTLYLGKDIEVDTYENIEETNNKLHQNDGQFKYLSQGFYFNTKLERETINYDDIILVQTQSIQLFDESLETNLEIFTIKKNYIFKVNTKDGYEKLFDKLVENLPTWNFQEVYQNKKPNYNEKIILFKR